MHHYSIRLISKFNSGILSEWIVGKRKVAWDTFFEVLCDEKVHSYYLNEIRYVCLYEWDEEEGYREILKQELCLK